MFDGFSMVFPHLDYYHCRFFAQANHCVGWFLMVFKNSRSMISDGPSLQSTVEVIYESYEVMTKTWVHGDEVSNGWVHWDGGAHEVEDVLLLGDGVLNALHLGHSMIHDT